MSQLVSMLFGFLPPWFQVLIQIGIFITLIIIVLKIIGLILDAIPFL